MWVRLCSKKLGNDEKQRWGEKETPPGITKESGKVVGDGREGGHNALPHKPQRAPGRILGWRSHRSFPARLEGGETSSAGRGDR